MGQAETVEILLKNGAILHEKIGKFKKNALIAAAENGHSDVCVYLLKKGAEILGYDVILEKNREFIRRNLGCDTIPLGD